MADTPSSEGGALNGIRVQVSSRAQKKSRLKSGFLIY